jgi:hypothetical protein
MTEAVISKVFKRDRHCGIIEMTVRTGALLTPICHARQRESQDEEIRNVGRESQETEVESTFAKHATSEIQDTAPTASPRAPRRKGG